MTDELEADDSNEREESNKPAQQPKTSADRPHNITFEAIELQNILSFAVLTVEDWEGSILFTFELVQHHGTP